MTCVNDYNSAISNINASNQECPNCWGYSEWQDTSRKVNVQLDKVADIISLSRDGFIRKFVKRYL